MDYNVLLTFCIYGGLTHVLADFLSNYRTLKKRGGWCLVLHCFLYTLFFIPIFIWMEVNFFWLFLIFFSHLIIDQEGQGVKKHIELFVRKYVKGKEDAFLKIIILGFDQVLHLSAIVIIAFFAKRAEEADHSTIVAFCVCAGTTHFLAILLMKWCGLEKKGKVLLVLNCIIYTLLFIPVLYLLEIDIQWLMLIFGSRLIIYPLKKHFESFLKGYLKHEAVKGVFLKAMALGLNQVLYLSVIAIIPLFV